MMQHHVSDDGKTTGEPLTVAADLTDAAAVVTGPVGSARLKDPATSGDIGADVHELPTVEAPDAEAGGVAPPEPLGTPRAPDR
jgi:hypothetical protein